MKYDFAPAARLVFEASRNRLVVFVTFGLASLLAEIGAEPFVPAPSHARPLEAQFRGCEPQGWCRFWIEALDPRAESLVRVRPEGVSWTPGGDTVSIAVRDRLNTLLAGMIHQHKRIVLHDLRGLGEGTYAAMVTVNGMDVASDPVLVELRQARTGASR